MDIVRAIHDKRLFKPCFRDLETWQSWEVLLKALFALPMGKDDLELFKACTGRDKAPKRAFREFWGIVGRRGGKSFMSAVVACYLALFKDYGKHLAPGENGVVLVVAADRAQAQVILNYIKGILHTHAVFEQYLKSELKESVELTNGISIEVMSCSYRLTRGRTVVCGIFDEVAFWRVEGANPDKEILSAVRPSMATIPESVLIVISSPYARFGVLYEHYQEYFGQDDPDILVWHADTRTMNPTIPQKLIDKEAKKDPNAARSEWQALFRDDIEAFLDPDIVKAAAVLPGEMTYQKYAVYSAFCDPSGGRRDAFTLAIGHYDFSKQKYAVDLLKAHDPPFVPSDVVFDYAKILNRYRLSQVVGDHYAAAWVAEAFKKEGISYLSCEKPKSELYLDFEGYINTRQVAIPRNQQLENELCALERRRGKRGRDFVDHPPRGSDDRANAVAGLVHLLTSLEDSAFSGCDLS